MLFARVCDSVHGGGGLAGRHPPGRQTPPLAGRHPPRTTTPANGMHPAGMHSCSKMFSLKNLNFWVIFLLILNPNSVNKLILFLPRFPMSVTRNIFLTQSKSLNHEYFLHPYLMVISLFEFLGPPSGRWISCPAPSGEQQPIPSSSKHIVTMVTLLIWQLNNACLSKDNRLHGAQLSNAISAFYVQQTFWSKRPLWPTSLWRMWQNASIFQ